MDVSDEILPPLGLLTGGNAQEMLTTQPRRDPSTARRGNGGPHPPPLGDPQSITQPVDDAGNSDPLARGFEKIMERFDNLEFRLEATDRRVDDLEVPIVPDPDPPYFSDDPDFSPNRVAHDIMASEGDVPRFFNHGSRGRGGDIRRRRMDFRDQQRRDGRIPDRNQGIAAYRSRPYPRQWSAWDRPQVVSHKS